MVAIEPKRQQTREQPATSAIPKASATVRVEADDSGLLLKQRCAIVVPVP
jgi:hypothetical protein